MQGSADVIVVGLGAVGSATLYQLAKRGVAALGIDAYDPPHQQGSSHGDTRITRLALGEGAQYVPLARRSHEIWRELESSSGRALLRTVGCLIYGPCASAHTAHGAADFLATTIDVARRSGLAHEILGADALRQRFPQFRFADGDEGCFEPSGGFVHPEACIDVQLAEARQRGARTHTGERVRRWTASARAVEVVTDRAAYRAERLILAAGAWLPALVAVLAPRLRVCRQVMFWFVPDHRRAGFGPDQMPVFVRLSAAPGETFYGFPALDGRAGGLKIAGEQFERAVDPDRLDANVAPDEVAAMYALAAPHLHITANCVRAVTCKYTVTPDFSFAIDRAPDSDRVWFASACSGHGFKHSAALGEALADLATIGRSSIDLSPFSLARFGTAPFLHPK